MRKSKQFGVQPSLNDIEKYTRSKQWNRSVFENMEPTQMSLNSSAITRLLYERIFKGKNRSPLLNLPIIPFDKVRFEDPANNRFKAVWFGHSAILMRIQHINIFIDPMLGSNAAPISPFPVKRFSEKTMDIIDELPELDLVLLSHDHYDHLDYDSIVKIDSRTKHFLVALGVARHLISWGIDESRITEFDWWDERTVDGVKITFTPSRHFSGRGLKDRAKSLWGGWVFDTGSEKIWFSGDGGYGKHFKEIGERFGSFDFAFMECGQYNELWHPIHLCPEETVQAAIDAKVRAAMPVHWAAFALAQHSWTDPIERFVTEAQRKGVQYITPRLGEEISLLSNVQLEWWKDV